MMKHVSRYRTGSSTSRDVYQGAPQFFLFLLFLLCQALYYYRHSVSDHTEVIVCQMVPALSYIHLVDDIIQIKKKLIEDSVDRSMNVVLCIFLGAPGFAD